ISLLLPSELSPSASRAPARGRLEHSNDNAGEMKGKALSLRAREDSGVRKRSGLIVAASHRSMRGPRNRLDQRGRQLPQSSYKDGDELAIELRVSAALEFREGFGGAARLLVRAVRCNRVVRVGDRNDP